MGPRRLWGDAVAAWEGVGCIICARHPRELAHVLGRAYDEKRGKARYVHPETVVPLCRDHHQQYDSHALNLEPHLRRYPLVVAKAKLRVGEGNAMRRIIGREYLTIQHSEE